MSRHRLLSRSVQVLVLALALAMGQVFAAPVAPGDATAVAAAWLRTGRAGLSGTLPAAPREFSAGGQRLAYIYDLSPAGYVVVPADDTVEPILVYSKTGRFQEREGAKPSVLADMLSIDIPARIGAAKTTAPGKWATLRAVARGERAGATERLTISTGPLLSTTWNQGDESAPYTYDYYTPNHYVCGCVATAMAQIVRFHQHPASVNVSNTVYVDDVAQSASFSGNLNYGLMPNSITDSSPDNQRQEIGKLTWACGISVGMSYASGGSGANTADVAGCLVSDFGYVSADWKSGADSDWGNVLRTDLNDGYPAQLAINGNAGGHSIVCDGWGTEGADYRYHLNMGWGGAEDAWYQVPGFTTGSMTWPIMRGFVYNIRPLATARLNFLTQPSATTVGAAIAPSVRVEALTAGGSRDTSFTGSVTVSLSNNPGSATLGGTLTRAAVAGVATFDDLTVSAVGTGYTLQAVATNYSAANSNAFSVLGASVSAPFRDDFSTDKGWVGYAADRWERGPAVGSTYDPASDTTATSDGYLLGYNIGGNYGSNLPQQLIMTPPIDCSALTQVTLSFQRALTIEEAAYDQAAVVISTDGTSWTPLWIHNGATVNTPTWSESEYDITDIAAGEPTVIVGFVMGTSDESVERGGWSIDDFYVGAGPSIVATPTELTVVEGSSNTFDVTLSEQPAATTTVTTAHASGDTDLSVTGGATLTFTTANWNTPQTVTISAAEDVDLTSDSATFDLTATDCAGTTVTVNEADNDAPRVLATPTELTVPEGGTNTVGLTLSAAPAANVVVNTAWVSGDADLTVSGGAQLTFTPTNWNVAQTVTFAAAQDADAINGAAVFRAGGANWEAATIEVSEIDDDNQIRVSPTAINVPEGATQTFGVTLASEPGANVTVGVARASGDASLTVPANTTLVFTPSNWDTPQVVTVSATEDGDAANGQAVFTASASGWADASVTATEVDNDGRLIVSPTSVTVAEGGTQTFGVRLAGNPGSDLTVSVSRFSGDPDLTVVAGASLVFGPSNWGIAQQVTIAAATDSDAINGSAVFRAAATGWEPADVTASEIDGNLSIVAAPANIAVAEGGSRTFGVRLAGRPAADLTVNVARVRGDSSLCVLAGAELTFTPSNWNVGQLVTVGAAKDLDFVCGTAIFRATAAGWAAAEVTATEVDDDKHLLVAPLSIEVPEGGAQAYSVRLAGQPSEPVTVTNIRVSGDSSLRVTSGLVQTFTSANWHIPQTVVVGAVHDIDVANGQAVIRARAEGWPVVDVAATEIDNDLRIVTAPSTIEVAEGGSQTFTVWLAGKPAADVSVTVGRVRGDSSLSGGGTLIFTPENYNVPQTVTVSAAQDSDVANGTAVFRASSAGWQGSEVTATEIDNDARILATPATVGVPENGTATFNVRLAGAPAANVVIGVNRLSGDTDLRGGANLTFTPTNWNVPQAVTVSAVNDLDAVAGSAVFRASRAGWESADVTVTETDDDAYIITAPNTISVAEGGLQTFTVRLAGRPAGTTFVAVGRLAGDFSLRVLSGASLAFTPTDWQTPQTVTVTAVDDSDVLDSEAFFSASSPGWTSGMVTATEVDNDRCVMAFPAELSVPEGETRTFAVRLGGPPTSEVTVNVIKLEGDADLRIVGGAELTFTASNWHVPQYVTVSARADSDRANGVAAFRASAPGWTPVDATVTEVDTASRMETVGQPDS